MYDNILSLIKHSNGEYLDIIDSYGVENNRSLLYTIYKLREIITCRKRWEYSNMNIKKIYAFRVKSLYEFD